MLPRPGRVTSLNNADTYTMPRPGRVTSLNNTYREVRVRHDSNNAAASTAKAASAPAGSAVPWKEHALDDLGRLRQLHLSRSVPFLAPPKQIDLRKKGSRAVTQREPPDAMKRTSTHAKEVVQSYQHMGVDCKFVPDDGCVAKEDCLQL